MVNKFLFLEPLQPIFFNSKGDLYRFSFCRLQLTAFTMALACLVFNHCVYAKATVVAVFLSYLTRDVVATAFAKSIISTRWVRVNLYCPRTKQKSRESNPGPLGEKRESYLCAMRPHKLYVRPPMVVAKVVGCQSEVLKFIS